MAKEALLSKDLIHQFPVGKVLRLDTEENRRNIRKMGGVVVPDSCEDYNPVSRFFVFANYLSHLMKATDGLYHPGYMYAGSLSSDLMVVVSNVAIAGKLVRPSRVWVVMIEAGRYEFLDDPKIDAVAMVVSAMDDFGYKNENLVGEISGMLQTGMQEIKEALLLR